MKKARVYTTQARYEFSNEHQATVSLQCGENWRNAEAVDVSKSHLCVLAEPCEQWQLDAAFTTVTLVLADKEYVLRDLIISKLEVAQNSKLWRLVLRNETDSENAAENSRQLWQLSYALRQRAAEDDGRLYDELTLPKVPAREIAVAPRVADATSAPSEVAIGA